MRLCSLLSSANYCTVDDWRYVMSSSGINDWWVDRFAWCDDDECGWEGETEVCIDLGELMEYFTCPKCGWENVSSHDPVYE